MLDIRKYHVASGSYQVGSHENTYLYAFLGTCLGVVIYDAKNKVGGLCHLLLPEPISQDAVDYPEKYASTGLPLFLEALFEKGAQREHMKAYIAGGALVTPLYQYDLALDIGGRTYENVKRQLANEEIEVLKSETGGFFACCISLNLITGNCMVEPAEDTRLHSDKIPKLPKPEDITRTIHTLKPIPQVALKILRMVAEGLDDIKIIAEEVKKDQVISAKTLKICNSAHFSRPVKFESLDHALVYLGKDAFVKLILNTAVNEYFTQSEVGYSLCKGGIYHHAIGCALVAEQLALMTEKEIPSVAYTAGLLHDIGKVVLDQYVHLAYPLFYRGIKDESQSILKIEKRLFGITHTEIGKILSQKWDLAACHKEVIQYHHAPNPEDKQQHLVRIVYLADLLMTQFCSGFEFEKATTENLKTHLELLGLSLDAFPLLVDRIPKKAMHHFIL